MPDLDFSGLSDDQVVELARAAAREAVLRNPAAKAALEQAIATEAEQLDAQVRGGAAAKQRILDSIRRRAESEALARHEAEEEAAWSRSLQKHLLAAAELVGRPASDITASDYHDGGSRLVRIVTGANPAGPGWYLVLYNPATDTIATSPALRSKHAQALAWAREFHAATRDPAGKYHREAILKGIDL